MARQSVAEPPMDWLQAEYHAEENLASAGETHRGAYPHRAARDVLTLTYLFGEWEEHGHASATDTVGLVRHRLTSDAVWAAWCAAHLDDPGDARNRPGLAHARQARAWLWGRSLPLREVVRRGPVVLDRQPYDREQGWALGLRLARAALDHLLLADAGLPGLLGRWVPIPLDGGTSSGERSGRIEEVVWHPEPLTTRGPAVPLAFRVRGDDGAVTLVPAGRLPSVRPTCSVAPTLPRP
ncbi:hypothetical protein [Streptomyces sp. NPDC056632]|uniref:hypothetical protein n=1 Tax=Streptomyces sp. NPDC056632 TaxID=3345884 RepID=UPI003682CD51